MHKNKNAKNADIYFLAVGLWMLFIYFLSSSYIKRLAALISKVSEAIKLTY